MNPPVFDGFSDTYEVLKNPVVCTLDDEKRCGVLRQNNSFSEYSRIHYSPKIATKVPKPPEGPVKHLAGRHMFGGWLRPHFGHFLMEGTPCLWALDDLPNEIESLVFIPFGRSNPRVVRKKYQAFLDLVTGGKDVTIADTPMSVDELVMPEPGFGHGHRIEGSNRYREYFRERIAANVPAEGPKRLYISRTALPDKRGGIFGEELVEELMQANGYTVFHPQHHGAAVQLAHYRAAEEIVALDGSALHMAAYAIRPGTRVGIIFRRRADFLEGLVRQLKVFADAEVYGFDALRNCWIGQDARRVDYASIGEWDMPRLFKMLRDRGFVKDCTLMREFGKTDIDDAVAALDRGPMRPIPMKPAA